MLDPWITFAAAVLATYCWRFAGVLIGNRIETQHPVFEWFTCLAYSVMGALVARTVFLPNGLLTTVDLWKRVLSISVAFLFFFRFGRRLWIGIIAGETMFIFLVMLG